MIDDLKCQGKYYDFKVFEEWLGCEVKIINVCFYEGVVVFKVELVSLKECCQVKLLFFDYLLMVKQVICQVIEVFVKDYDMDYDYVQWFLI